MSETLVRCIYCNFFGTTYVWRQSELIKVTDPLIRVSSKQSDVALYAHQHCIDDTLKGIE